MISIKAVVKFSCICGITGGGCEVMDDEAAACCCCCCANIASMFCGKGIIFTPILNGGMTLLGIPRDIFEGFCCCCAKMDMASVFDGEWIEGDCGCGCCCCC